MEAWPTEQPKLMAITPKRWKASIPTSEKRYPSKTKNVRQWKKIGGLRKKTPWRGLSLATSTRMKPCEEKSHQDTQSYSAKRSRRTLAHENT